MKVISYIVYGLWIVSAAVLKILGLVSWWVATSWLWFPAALAVTLFVSLNLSVWIGETLKKKEISKIPDSCDTCLFGQTRAYAENEKCLGCTMLEGHEYGNLCSMYKRFVSK